MKKYYRNLKWFPGGFNKGSLFKIDLTGIYCSYSFENKEDDIIWHKETFVKEDLEEKEYFEESIGISKDGYILFKGDEIYWLSSNVIMEGRTYGYSYLDKYYKQENVPIINELSKNWEDLKTIEGYSINDYDDIFKARVVETEEGLGKKIFKTKKQAQSCLVFAQLSQLVADMNEDWIPLFDVNNNQTKFVVLRIENKLERDWFYTSFFPLCFKTAELRDFSFDKHNKLWKQYYQL